MNWQQKKLKTYIKMFVFKYSKTDLLALTVAFHPETDKSSIFLGNPGAYCSTLINKNKLYKKIHQK